MVKRSIDSLAASVVQAHVELQRLPPEHPDYEKTQARLSRRLTAWANGLNISIRVAENEQLPYSSSELGLSCRPMTLKKTSGFNQVGDYQAYSVDYNRFVGLLIERKTLTDLYNTLMSNKQRSRLYREIEKYKTDKRFNRFILIAECTYEEFLGYVPSIYVCQWEAIPGAGATKLIEYLRIYYEIEHITPKHIYKTDTKIFVSCEDHIEIELKKDGTASLLFDNILKDTLYIEEKYGKRNLYQKKGATEKSKRETINSLENKIQISFVGSRERAVQKLPGLFRQWCRHKYIDILNLS